MEKQGNKTLGIIGIVCGAFAIVCFWVPWWNIAAIIAGVVGIVLAVLSKKSYKEAGLSSPIPTIALVLSIVGTVFSVIGLFACTVCVCAIGDAAAKNPNWASDLESAISSAVSQ